MKACVFYATHTAYAVALLVFVRELRRLGIGDGIDLVALHLPLPRPLLEALRAAGIRTVAVPPPPAVADTHCRRCLVKLHAFQLDGYERLVVLDADALPLRRLDFLFDLPMPKPLAAPLAYWRPHRWFSSALLVVEPRADLWPRIAARLAAARRRREGLHDMDVLNYALGEEIEPLAAGVFCLDSEWEQAGRGNPLGDADTLAVTAALVHFTALGKPWSHAPQRVRRLRAGAHPFFHRLRERWWQAREDIIAAAPPALRWRLQGSRLLGQMVRTQRFLDRVAGR